MLVIRAFLEATGYPQVGGESLHIAHMLWGGLLMLAALLILLSFLGRRSRMWAAFLGGVGFGTFIDEVGKFVTHDNNYFYRPAGSLIYVTFIVTYLIARGIRGRTRVSREEYLLNALQELEEAVLHDLQLDERDRALRYLSSAGADDRLAGELSRVVSQSHVAPQARAGFARRAQQWLLIRYRRLATHPAFEKGLVVIFVGQLLVKLAAVAVLVLRPEVRAARRAWLGVVGEVGRFTTVEWLQLGSSALSALFVAAGVVALTRSRKLALRLFHRSLLVSIMLTQVFMFYRDATAALALLAFNLLMLTGLNFMRERESAMKSEGRAAV